MLPSFPQRPHQTSGRSNTGSNAYTSFEAGVSAVYPFSQRGDLGPAFGAGAGYPIQESADRFQTFTQGTITAQGGVGITLSGGNALDGATGGRLENPYVPAGPPSSQQHLNKPHKQESLGDSSDAPSARSFSSKLYKLMQDPAAKARIYWDDHGTVVTIPNQGELENANLLNRYFGHNNFDSLVRQFNNYGFRKLNRAGRAGDNHHHLYFHDKFRKGREDLLCEVKPKPKGREPFTEPMKLVGGQPSALLAGHNIAGPAAAPQLETTSGRIIPRESTEQLSRRFSLMNESVVALENRNRLLENENIKLKAAYGALQAEKNTWQVEKKTLQAEKEDLKERNTRLERYLGTVTTQFDGLKMLLSQWTGSASSYMTGDNVLGVRPKAAVPAQMWYTGNVHQHAGGAIPGTTNDSQTSISVIHPPCDSPYATAQFLQHQPPNYPPIPDPTSLDPSHRQSPETRETRASGSAAPHAYWGNQPYMEDVDIGLPVDNQYAMAYQTRQPLAESTLRKSPISRSQGSPSRRSGNPVAQVPRPHPGSGGPGHSYPLPGALAADSGWT